MIICSCNVISDHEIKEAVVSADVELYSTAQVYDSLGRLVQCGLCAHSVRAILQEWRAGFGDQNRDLLSAPLLGKRPTFICPQASLCRLR
jgi:bacterioferritin-associated ferredoxin